MSRNGDLYTEDFYTWTQTTAALIRAGKWTDIDPESLAEEVEAWARSAAGTRHRLDVLLVHLLKWHISLRGARPAQLAQYHPDTAP